MFGYDKVDMIWWLEENTEEVYEENYDYDYLTRIITVVREAVINNYVGGESL